MARPKEFAPDDALDKAMHMFWAKGYYDTSIRDLVTATGVNPYGLYATFKDKRGLFLAALDHYQATVTSAIGQALEQPDGGLGAIGKAFDHVLRITRDAHGHSGCLMCMTAVELAPHDAMAADRVAANMTRLRDAFLGAVRRAQRKGEIDPGKDAEALAEFLATSVYSIGMLRRAGRNSAYVNRYVQTALEGLA